MGGILKKVSLERKKLRKEKVLKLLSNGLSIKDIANKINLSGNSVYKIIYGDR